MELNEMSLIYVNRIGKNSDGLYEYEFYLSETPDIAWAEDWAEQCPSACVNMEPEESMYSKKVRLNTDMPLSLIQENSCFSYQDCIDGITAIAYENISEYENYPEPYRVVIAFGETFSSIKDKFGGRGIEFDETGE